MKTPGCWEGHAVARPAPKTGDLEPREGGEAPSVGSNATESVFQSSRFLQEDWFLSPGAWWFHQHLLALFSLDCHKANHSGRVLLRMFSSVPSSLASHLFSPTAWKVNKHQAHPFHFLYRHLEKQPVTFHRILFFALLFYFYFQFLTLSTFLRNGFFSFCLSEQPNILFSCLFRPTMLPPGTLTRKPHELKIALELYSSKLLNSLQGYVSSLHPTPFLLPLML